MLAGLSRLGIRRVPPRFWASAIPATRTSASATQNASITFPNDLMTALQTSGAQTYHAEKPSGRNGPADQGCANGSDRSAPPCLSPAYIQAGGDHDRGTEPSQRVRQITEQQIADQHRTNHLNILK